LAKTALIVFLPFLALGLASVKFGNRFSMYGTVASAWAGVGDQRTDGQLKQSQGRRWIAQLSMACVALWPSADFMQQVGLSPYCPRPMPRRLWNCVEKLSPKHFSGNGGTTASRAVLRRARDVRRRFAAFGALAVPPGQGPLRRIAA
jgi:hypothetical protein